MRKTISEKEFKRILSEAGLADNYGSILSIICIYYNTEAASLRKDGYTVAAEHFDELGSRVYNNLEKLGYLE